MLVVYDLLVRVSDDIVEKGSVVSGGGVQSCLEQILHIVQVIHFRLRFAKRACMQPSQNAADCGETYVSGCLTS
jgi:hypothetical protein